MSDVVIKIENYSKTYVTPFRRRLVHAVKNVSMEVKRGEIYGFLGHNGAGKTTTIRTLMGLIKPTSGEMAVLGHPVPSRAARQRIGFLPESPYFYDYLSIRELCDLTGRLFGMDSAARRKRADYLIDLVGMNHAANKPLKSYSKGMLQRAGIAQSLVNDPDLVVMDEPMSGLDPIGRKEVRDIILNLRDQGKTIFFSTHILADVEMICDRIAIIAHGVLKDVGTLRQLVGDTVSHTDVILRLPTEKPFNEAAVAESPEVLEVRHREGELNVRLKNHADVDAFIRKAWDGGAHVVAVVPFHDTLEDVFVRRAAEVAS
jgi:ABC-2 type transport system ATP-binding protein